jgi:hypothetical protein
MAAPKPTGKHIAEKIYAFLSDKEVLIDTERLAAVDELMVEMYRQQHEDVTKTYSGHINPVTCHSATKCYLSNWFKHNQFPAEPFHPRVVSNFTIGHVVEREMLYWLLLQGEEISHIQDRRKVKIGGWESSAYCDWIHKSKVDGKRRLVDAKSQSNYGYKKIFDWHKAVDDSFGYLGQFSLYMKEWGEAGLIDEPWETIMLCFKKDTGHINEIVIPYNPHKVEEAHSNSLLIQAHTTYKDCECVEKRDMEPLTDCEKCWGKKSVVVVGASDSNRPERPRGMEPEVATVNKNREYVLPLSCSYCDYKWSCWTRPNARVDVEMNDKYSPVPIFTSQPEQRPWLEYEKGSPKFCVRRKKSNAG